MRVGRGVRATVGRGADDPLVHARGSARTIFSASSAVPNVVTARKYDVRCSRPHGSPSKPEWSITPAIASGCSDCISSARIPPTNIDASPCTCRIGAPVLEPARPVGAVDPLAAPRTLGAGDPCEEPVAHVPADVGDDGETGYSGHAFEYAGPYPVRAVTMRCMTSTRGPGEAGPG